MSQKKVAAPGRVQYQNPQYHNDFLGPLFLLNPRTPLMAISHWMIISIIAMECCSRIIGGNWCRLVLVVVSPAMVPKFNISHLTTLITVFLLRFWDLYPSAFFQRQWSPFIDAPLSPLPFPKVTTWILCLVPRTPLKQRMLPGSQLPSRVQSQLLLPDAWQCLMSGPALLSSRSFPMKQSIQAILEKTQDTY